MSRRTCLALSLLVTACSSTPPEVPQIRIGGPDPTAGPEVGNENRLVFITAAPRPRNLVVDGDVAEWQSPLFTAPGAPPAPAAAPSPAPSAAATSSPAAPPKGRPAGESPDSTMLVALTSDGLTVAGEMTSAFRDGFWLSVLLDTPQVPPIGVFRNTVGVEPLTCDEALEPDSLAYCQKLLDDHEAFSNRHLARFEERYFVAPEAVSTHRGGKSSPIEGAQVAFKKAPRGFHFELTLPARSLPRTQQAIVSSLHAGARIGSPAAPPAFSQEERSVVVVDDVGFEPYAALRAMVFEAAARHSPFRPFTLSYQPGDGLEVADLTYVTSSFLTVSEELLYSRQATLGHVEVGYAYTGAPDRGLGWTSVLSLVKGVPVGIVDLDGTAVGVVQRDGEIHALTFSSAESDDAPLQHVHWGVAAIGPDGRDRDDVLDATPWPAGIFDPKESHAPDFSTLTIRGRKWQSGKVGDAVEATWRWDPKTKRYEVTVAGASLPAPKNGPKAPKK